MRIWSVAPVLKFVSKQTDSRAGPRSLSGQDELAVRVISPPETGSMTAESADAICTSKLPHPHIPCGVRAKAMPELVQLNNVYDQLYPFALSSAWVGAPLSVSS